MTSEESEDGGTRDEPHELDPGEAELEPGPDEVFCTSCGEIIKEQAEICPKCGVRQKDAPRQVAQEKNPGLAAVGSFLYTGIGQIYNGQIAKGILLMIVQFVNILLMFVVIGFFTFFIVWIYGIYDAYRTAEKINKGEIKP